MSKHTFQNRLDSYQSRVDVALDRYLPSEDPPEHNLAEAIRYSVMGGGKRIRPAMVYAAGEAMGVATDLLDIPACAVEMIHAYSLIHDDLPAMDDDDLRRGRPTCHKAFDEATAMLAGDALQALAYEILAKDKHVELTSEHRIKMLSLLTEASGARLHPAVACGGQSTGRGGVGIIRISGQHSTRLAKQIAGSLPVPRQAELCSFRNQQGELIVLGIHFPVQFDVIVGEIGAEKIIATIGSRDTSGFAQCGNIKPLIVVFIDVGVVPDEKGGAPDICGLLIKQHRTLIIIKVFSITDCFAGAFLTVTVD